MKRSLIALVICRFARATKLKYRDVACCGNSAAGLQADPTHYVKS